MVSAFGQTSFFPASISLTVACPSVVWTVHTCMLFGVSPTEVIYVAAWSCIGADFGIFDVPKSDMGKWWQPYFVIRMDWIGLSCRWIRWLVLWPKSQHVISCHLATKMLVLSWARIWCPGYRRNGFRSFMRHLMMLKQVLQPAQVFTDGWVYVSTIRRYHILTHRQELKEMEKQGVTISATSGRAPPVGAGCPASWKLPTRWSCHVYNACMHMYALVGLYK